MPRMTPKTPKVKVLTNASTTHHRVVIKAGVGVTISLLLPASDQNTHSNIDNLRRLVGVTAESVTAIDPKDISKEKWRAEVAAGQTELGYSEWIDEQ